MTKQAYKLMEDIVVALVDSKMDFEKVADIYRLSPEEVYQVAKLCGDVE